MHSPYYHGYNIATATRAVFAKYIKFTGRSTRSEFWWAFVFFWCAGGIVAAIAGKESYLYTLYGVAVILPFLGVTIRRLHDSGKSGWNIFWYFLPVIGWIIEIVLLCRDSQFGTNQYGPSEKYPGN